MTFEEMVVALVASVGGIALVGYVFAKIIGLIKAWINRNNNALPEEEFNRLAKAFVEHKKDTQRRLQNLEAIIADGDPAAKSQKNKQTKQIEAPRKTIEIEDTDSEKEESPKDSDGNLRNMLRE